MTAQRLDRAAVVTRQGVEGVAVELDEIVVVDPPGRHGDHAAGAVMILHVAEHVIAREAADAVDRAQNRATDRLVGIGGLLEQIEDDVVGRVVDLGDLLHDDLALALELFGGHHRVLQDIGQDVDGERHVLLEHTGDEGGLLARGIGVEVAADRFDLLDDGERAAPLGALERHVLQEMRDAVELAPLDARASVDPDADRRGLETRHVDGGDPQAVFECCDAGFGHAAPLILFPVSTAPRM